MPSATKRPEVVLYLVDRVHSFPEVDWSLQCASWSCLHSEAYPWPWIQVAGIFVEPESFLPTIRYTTEILKWPRIPWPRIQVVVAPRFTLPCKDSRRLGGSSCTPRRTAQQSSNHHFPSRPTFPSPFREHRKLWQLSMTRSSLLLRPPDLPLVVNSYHPKLECIRVSLSFGVRGSVEALH